jgi:hypothetical protein
LDARKIAVQLGSPDTVKSTVEVFQAVGTLRTYAVQTVIGQKNVRRSPIIAVFRIGIEFVRYEILHNYSVKGLILLSRESVAQGCNKECKKYQDLNDSDGGHWGHDMSGQDNE